MVTIINTHEVQNFNDWKAKFEAGAEMRTKAGMVLKNVFQHNDNPNMVTVITEMPDATSAKTFIANITPMIKANGIIGEPHFMVLDKVM